MSVRLGACWPVVALALAMPLSLPAQTPGSAPTSSPAPAAPNSNQPKAPLAPGVSSGIRTRTDPVQPEPQTPAVDPNASERDSSCSEARFPSEGAPPCTVQTPPAGQ